MSDHKQIKSALISVYHKEGLDEIIRTLSHLKVTLYSTGGTLSYIRSLGADAMAVEDLTSYPSILGGRVKTLHPKVFGGILSRREVDEDNIQVAQYDIPEIDLVIVDLYPFEETVASNAPSDEIIEKIDIGGISLIRASAKNFNDVLVIPSRYHYSFLAEVLKTKNGYTDLDDRRNMAMEAFNISSHYDTAIFNYFDNDLSIVRRISYGQPSSFKLSVPCGVSLRYGENPHQKGMFFGRMDDVFEKLNGKEISYNNLLDIDAGIGLINEFDATTIAVLKHNNPCGAACDDDLVKAWRKALDGDPLSAFGGVIMVNRKVTLPAAEEINKLFFEVILAPDYEPGSLELLKSKKNRIILKQKQKHLPVKIFRSALNGVIVQDRDMEQETFENLKTVTHRSPTPASQEELLFANKLVKHAKSNSIVLTKGKQLIGIGTGHVSRVDALKFAIEKARSTGKDVKEAALASDAFFPFDDCVKIAYEAGIMEIIQPGGSVRDNDSIEFCNRNNMAMVFTGIRHFKH